MTPRRPRSLDTNELAEAEPYITSCQLAELAGISERAAKLAVQRCRAGRPWRACVLDVITEHGRGGQSGRVYKVALDSLPAELQAKWRAAHGGPTGGGSPADSVVVETPPAAPPPLDMARLGLPAAKAAGAAVWQRRWEAIRPALACRARSAERAAAIAMLADATGNSKSTLWRWIAAYEADGFAGLVDNKRADTGRRRFLVSWRWDAAVAGGIDEEAREKIAGWLTGKIRSLWAAGTPGWRRVARLATVGLIAETRAAGFDRPDAEMVKICAVPRGVVDRQRRYRIIAVKDKDAKAYFDREPRIRRDYSALKPMELVKGDVHPVDIYYRRDDGSLATPKLIAWQDAATNRIIGHAVFLDKGKGVRMAHVAASFAHMVQAWGMPAHLYLDNGGEYNWSEFADDAMKLVKAYGEDRRTVINAQPYNAPAKKIEGAFAVLEGGAFAMIPGWIGGNRMVKKTQNVGREPEPFPGGTRELWLALNQAIADYNATPQAGLGGRSPDQAWKAHIEAGWRPVAAGMETLQTAFARKETRRLRQGGFKVGGQIYTHDALCSRPDLETVTLGIPIFGDMRPAVFAPDGVFLCHAEPETAYHPLDIEGAKESGRRKTLARRGVEDLRRDVEPVDLAAETAAFLALNPPPEEPEPDGVIRLAPEMDKAAVNRRELPAERKAREADEREREQARRDALWERYFEGVSRQGSGG